MRPSSTPSCRVLSSRPRNELGNAHKDSGLGARNPEVTVCVLTEGEPMPRYLTLYGHATIETKGAVGLMMRVARR